MQILPLTDELIPHAKRLVSRVFPHQSPSERLSFWAYAHKRSFVVRLCFKLFGIKDLMGFWGAVKDGTDEIIATTGLYSYERDAEEAVWLAWFCVAPEERGSGLGSKMLDFSIERARDTGKQYLRLYTSDVPNEAAAQRLYEKKGFKIASVKSRLFFNTICREKIL